MPEPTNYQHRAPMNLDAFADRLARVRQWVPARNPGWVLGAVSISVHDFEWLLVALGQGLPARRSEALSEIAVSSVVVRSDPTVVRGEMVVEFGRPRVVTSKTVPLRC